MAANQIGASAANALAYEEERKRAEARRNAPPPEQSLAVCPYGHLSHINPVTVSETVPSPLSV